MVALGPTASDSSIVQTDACAWHISRMDVIYSRSGPAMQWVGGEAGERSTANVLQVRANGFRSVNAVWMLLALMRWRTFSRMWLTPMMLKVARLRAALLCLQILLRGKVLWQMIILFPPALNGALRSVPGPLWRLETRKAERPRVSPERGVQA